MNIQEFYKGWLTQTIRPVVRFTEYEEHPKRWALDYFGYKVLQPSPFLRWTPTPEQILAEAMAIRSAVYCRVREREEKNKAYRDRLRRQLRIN